MHYFTTIIRHDLGDTTITLQAATLAAATESAIRQFLAHTPSSSEDCIYQVKTTRH